jgi:16S rRNA (adenine1518-N6/adenine1519-N6)-dimethyltransferase
MRHPKGLLRELAAAPRKSLSQSFLIADYWAEKLSTCALQARRSKIIEIGAGLGALSEKWVGRVDEAVLVEYDRKLAGYLRNSFPGARVIESDVLDLDFRMILPVPDDWVVLSNLPYHISSAIFMKFVESGVFPARMVLTFQKEFAERLLARPKTKSYGALSILCQTYFELHSDGVLPPGAFYPRPAVSSEVIVFEPKPGPVSVQSLKRVVSAAFSHRRKYLARNLAALAEPSLVASWLDELGEKPSVRAEQLSPADYVWLAQRQSRC